MTSRRSRVEKGPAKDDEPRRRARSAPKDSPQSTPQAGESEMLTLRMYISGSDYHSVDALDNIGAICEEYSPEGYTIEIVDMKIDVAGALKDGVLVTPTLIRLAPLPQRRVVGDLSDRAKVITALGLRSAERTATG